MPLAAKVWSVAAGVLMHGLLRSHRCGPVTWGQLPHVRMPDNGAPVWIEAQIDARPWGRIDGDAHAGPRSGAWPNGLKRELDLLDAGVAADLVRATA
jgi:hypothetical protein